MAYTVRDCLTEAYRDIQVLAIGQPLDADQAADGLLKLTRLFDNWNAERAGVYADRPATYTLTAGLNPHTLGPTAATLTVAQRPVKIDGAAIILTGGTLDSVYPMNPRTAQWFQNITVPGVTSIPSDFWYNPTWPNGEIYLYPVPASTYGLKLLTRIVLADLAIDDDLSLPPGYRSAVILTLGEMIALTYPPAVASPEAAAKARARIYANNDVIPTLVTRDSGVPARGYGGRWFDYQSGVWRY